LDRLMFSFYGHFNLLVDSNVVIQMTHEVIDKGSDWSSNFRSS